MVVAGVALAAGRADRAAHFESYLKTGNLTTQPPETLSRVRGTTEHPVFDVTDERVRMIVDQMFWSDWRTGYAYASQLRDIATREILMAERSSATSFKANTIVANTMIQILGCSHYVSDAGPNSVKADRNGKELNKHVLASTLELVEHFGVPHSESSIF